MVAPRVGQIVTYRLAQHDLGRAEGHGNPLHVGDAYPMMIVRIWSDSPDHTTCVQGQVFVDGDYSLWVTSVKQGEDEGQWHA